MSKVVEYVGTLHLIKDHVKETWTQFWANLSSPAVASNGDETPHSEQEINFRTRVKVKLERLRQQSLHAVDNSSTEQDDFSHLTRSKSRKELMRISAAVMGIEFSYAAETAFVSPLLLNIGLRHRHMTLIWCLSPLLGFFLTPILGSLSDGCRSPLGRRRPFIILLSIGIVLGLILVPNGKPIGRMLGDKYRDDEPPDLKVPSEVSAHLLMNPKFPFTNRYSSTAAETTTIDATQSIETYTLPGRTYQDEITESPFWRNTFNTSAEKNSDNYTNENDFYVDEPKLAYKLRSSKNVPTEYEHGFRAWNSLTHKDKDEEQRDFFKNLARRHKSQKINREELKELLRHATEDGSSEEKNIGNSVGAVKTSGSNNNNNSSSSSTFRMDGTGATAEHMPRSKRLEASVDGLAESNNKDGASESSNFDSGNEDAIKNHPWGLVFTVIGTVLLDFDADACQSPSRAFMLDITLPEDHAKGLSTFTIMAGLGGSIGYFLGALNWEDTLLGNFFGGHVRAVFTLVLFIFIACVIVTLRSFREIPMDRLWANKPSGGLDHSATNAHGSGPASIDTNPKNNLPRVDKRYARLEDDSEVTDKYCDDHSAITQNQKSYGAIEETSFNAASQQTHQSNSEGNLEPTPTFREYVKTIVQLPRSLQWLCATNFFCWMSLVCYSLYFTDFVGEAVFGGDPTAPRGSILKEKYDAGVRFGCWGMSLYSLSCSIYSLCIESLVNRFGARRVYIYGQLVYSVGMVLMAMARHPAGVIIFSWTAGIMYATLFTMPYLLVARYHAAETFDVDVDDMMERQSQVRGLGTDVAIVSSMVFLAQITQALTLGVVVTAVGSTTAIVCAAAVFASCGALCARKVLYLDL